MKLAGTPSGCRQLEACAHCRPTECLILSRERLKHTSTAQIRLACHPANADPFSALYSKHIQFSVLSSQEIVAISELEVNQRDLYKPEDRSPLPHGVLDRRLGTSDKSSKCETCGLPLADCVGHYAYIKLIVPVFHIGYFRHCINVLQCICKVSGAYPPELRSSSSTDLKIWTDLLANLGRPDGTPSIPRHVSTS